MLPRSHQAKRSDYSNDTSSQVVSVNRDRPDCLSILIYFITLFGIKQELFFSSIAEMSLTGTENGMEILGYSLGQWFLMVGLITIGTMWLVIEDKDDR